MGKSVSFSVLGCREVERSWSLLDYALEHGQRSLPLATLAERCTKPLHFSLELSFGFVILALVLGNGRCLGTEFANSRGDPFRRCLLFCTDTDFLLGRLAVFSAAPCTMPAVSFFFLCLKLNSARLSIS